MASNNPMTQVPKLGDVSGNIRHVFVLMMENRSFDHVFGRYTGSDTKAMSEPDARKLDNLVNSPWFHRSLADAHGKAYDLSDAAAADHVSPDPPHEMEDTLFQLTGIAPDRDPHAQYSYKGLAKTNLGFISAYLSTPDIAALPQVGDPAAVIASWQPSDMGVLSALAQEYALCDKWFSSLPGPTWPNRLFVHAGHSGGLDYSPDAGSCAATFFVDGYNLGTTIFDQLHNNLVGDEAPTASIYTDGAIPLALCLKGISNNPMSSKAPILPYNQFAGDLAGGKLDLKKYIFIEPNYGKALGTNVTNEYDGGNSQHAVASFQAGEQLIADVYNAIRNSDLWSTSLLIITWDEHGGFFDHCAPPTDPSLIPAPGPGGPLAYSQHKFNFDTLGVRVPALFISPYVKKGYIDSEVRDHSVIPNFISSWFTTKPLPQGRQPSPNGVTGLSAKSAFFDWSLKDPNNTRLRNVSLTMASQAKLTLQKAASTVSGLVEPYRSTGIVGQGPASRTLKTRVVLAALAKAKKQAATAATAQDRAKVGMATKQAVQSLKTRDEHLDYIKKNT
jgi:phospholipase C